MNIMRMKTPRVAPIEEADWTDAQRAAVGKSRIDGRSLNIFKTLANYPDLARRWMVFANHVMGKSSIYLRDREILILRTGWLCKSGYEWGQHVLIGLNSGLSAEEIEQLKTGAASSVWSDNERLLLKATDELHSDAFISDSTWNDLAKYYDTEQLMDIIFTVGQYNLVSMALNTLGVQLDSGMILDEDLCK